MKTSVSTLVRPAQAMRSRGLVARIRAWLLDEVTAEEARQRLLPVVVGEDFPKLDERRDAQAAITQRLDERRKPPHQPRTRHAVARHAL